MNSNQQTLTRFYRAFAALDADTMSSCYAEDVHFDDPVFSLRGRREVGGMWRMLCAATQAKGRTPGNWSSPKAQLLTTRLRLLCNRP